MVCPLVPLVGVGAAVGGTHTIFIQDRSQRRLAWVVLLTLTGAWALYATVIHLKSVRIVLETLTVIAVLAGGYRAWWLARHRGVRSPLVARLSPIGRHLVACVRSPLVLAANAWLVAMLSLEWLRKAHFGALEYVLVCLVLAGGVTARTWSRMRARRVDPHMRALESFMAAAPTSACPLGFGGAVSAPGSTAPEAGDHADE